ncbi:MAG: adenylate/guanylate cyclase domain-containing protein [Acidimicrobiales bacterium]
MTAERRPLTVAFCDLVGSTELSSRLDAEEYGELIQAYQRRAVSVARRYGGEVESYLGDGILFRFGWPEAHDDDPERAVRASFEILADTEEITTGPERLAVRIGIHTGPVVIGEMGGAGQRQIMALGETLNLAARLQTIADPGTVVVSAATLALVSGIFVTDDLGPQVLRGSPHPSRVSGRAADRPTQPARRGAGAHTVRRAGRRVGPAPRPVERRRDGTGPMRARDRRSRRRQVAPCLPIAGGALGDPHSWLECAASSFTQGSVFRPAIELVEQGLQLQIQDTPTERWAALRKGLDALGLDDEAVELMAGLLALPADGGNDSLTMSPELRRRRTIEMLTEWVLAFARRQPLVVAIEDVHWSDPSSLELFGEIALQRRDAPVLLIATARPGFDQSWAEHRDVVTILLGPLNDGDVREMVQTLAGDRRLPAPVVERIVGDAAGIPLFAEEVGRMVLESGLLLPEDGRWVLTAPLAHLDIPSTLQGSLLARLDRLGPTKRVAQVAAVIGREFPYDLVAMLCEEQPRELEASLERLVASDLVFRDGEGPSACFVFKHALVQEAAYNSLLRRTRRTVHGRIADELARRRAADPTAAAEVVARHFEAAEAFEAAARHYQLAAEEAASRSGFHEAVAHLRRGISLLARVSGGRERDGLEIEMQLALGSAIIGGRSYSDPGIETAYARARSLCEGLGDDEQVGHALAGLSIFYTNRGEIDLGAELAERVLAIAAACGDDTLELLGRIQLAHPRLYQCRSPETLEHAQRALAIYDPARHRSIAKRFGTDHGVAAHTFAGWALMALGYADQALAHLDEAVALARWLGQPFDVAYALLFKASIHWARGDSDEVLAAAGAARAVAEEQGFDFWTGLSRVFQTCEQVVRTGDASLIPDVMEASLVAGESGNRGGSTPVLARVAEALRAAGDTTSALAVVDSALAVSAETGQIWWDTELQRLRAELLLDAANGVATGDGHHARTPAS